ncbi:hypothetical protein OESDEN_09016 [Oesophagostomum dentatum]|uniref:SXP/RAL-2 family protein Ani s 5-like cation-binding domain-containing protein n=1 Tax=Oesophagostomum dentatum TaxID=61180 RepID=A0A0B1T4U6_OESDE|nr:hypothetical protein OESDEN_09016 [Oesophagostomum dentatum]
MPEFLKHVSEEARIQFYFMMKDFTISFDKKLEELKEWAKKNNVEKEVDQWINKIEKFWDDVNKNMTKVVDELPKIYPKVYKILSDGSLTAMDMLLKIRALKLDRTVAKSLYAVSMVVIHSSGQDPYMTMKAGDFFEKVAGTKLKDEWLYDHILN